MLSKIKFSDLIKAFLPGFVAFTASFIVLLNLIAPSLVYKLGAAQLAVALILMFTFLALMSYVIFKGLWPSDPWAKLGGPSVNLKLVWRIFFFGGVGLLLFFLFVIDKQYTNPKIYYTYFPEAALAFLVGIVSVVLGIGAFFASI